MPDASSLMSNFKETLATTVETTTTAPDDARELWLFPPTDNGGTVSFRSEPGGTAIQLPDGIWTKIKDLNIAGRDWSYQRVGGAGGDILYYAYLLGEGE